MSAVYTPGLKVSDSVLLHLERRLPLAGQVCVKEGESVRHDQVVARTELPGRVDLVNVASKLGLEPSDVPAAMLVQVGQSLAKGAPLARSRGFFGYFRSTLESPFGGTLESVSAVTGQVVLRGAPSPVEVLAYVDGVIERVLEGEGVLLRTFGTQVQGIFGIGGETGGLLRLAGPPDRPLDEQTLGEEARGCVLVGGSLVSRTYLEKAIQCGARGVVCGGIDDAQLREFLGYDLGVAITGSENKGLTLILTEGFGEIPMARRTYELLQSRVGQRASISGATQIRAGVIRPEILVPRLEGDWLHQPERVEGGALEVGTRVRIIREPEFGALATVTELPGEPQVIPSEARVRVAQVKLDKGGELTLPRANLERLEETS